MPVLIFGCNYSLSPPSLICPDFTIIVIDRGLIKYDPAFYSLLMKV